ncbi:putative peptidylprolyl isomerase [Medicago truncatula]|uniref:peptidylprolyl isomerase n=1 Tax=Medicago truncatula TaxID=3880 RepID=G7JM35_MEDTR|nr:peptidyl-prolyl cis-trans isomerase PASTICCINO1 [Medicago truncatula]AES88468.2 peptidyl-prolyl cis-trans isomerase, FKBP-type protein [Medicago truncatula]RHN60565.1 putative peptidylprolyl isomerase [Medicago truncatula]
MAIVNEENVQQEFNPPKKKPPTEDEKRKKKIVAGSLMKALIRPGGGDSHPSDADQVIYHSTIRTLDGVVVESTRSDHGGKGTPIRHVLGKSKMLLGLLEGIPTMFKGEVAMFKMKPQLHYGEDDCPVSAPDGFPKDDELHFEIELIEFFKAKVITDDLEVVKKVVREGEGWESPREPYEVKAWISAKTVTGKLIMSHTEGEPYFFTFGKSEVPKGLEMGIGTMVREEKAVIYVTSQYLTESPLMPVIEDSEVQFEVELVHFVQVRDVLGDGRLIKRRIRDGKGDFPMDCPLHDSLLHVHYKGTVLNEENRVFYDTRVDNDGQPLDFCSGEGLVPEGFELCVRLMLPGEMALVTCPPDYAYDKFPRPSNVPEGAHIQWEIELLSFEMPKDWTGMDFKSIMNEAENIRNTGNRLFKEGKYELAKAKYEKVLREFNHVNPQDDEEGKIFSDTRNLLHLNVAACYLKLGECRKSIETCNKVLEANPAHVKGLYRRGMAYMGNGDFEEARADFKMMIKVDKSTESDATAALLKLKQKEQEVEKKARKQFKGLFDKKPGEIAEVKANDDENQVTSEIQKDGEVHEQDSSDGTNSEDSHEAAPDADQRGWFAHFWPNGSRIFSSLGLHRCTIL